MKGLKRRVERGALAAVLALCLAGRATAQLAEPVQASTEDLLQMTEESLYADWEENRAFVRGVGRVVQDTAQGRLLARRAALTDARRGLLLLRGHILEDPALRELRQRILADPELRGRALWLAGPVPPVRVLSERIEDGLYFIEVETALSRLLNRNGGVYVTGEMQRLKRKGAHAR